MLNPASWLRKVVYVESRQGHFLKTFYRKLTIRIDSLQSRSKRQFERYADPIRTNHCSKIVDKIELHLERFNGDKNAQYF